MQQEDMQSPWSFFEDMNSTFESGVESYGFSMYDHVGDSGSYGFIVDDHGLNTLLSTLEDSTSEISSIPFSSSSLFFSNDHVHTQYPIIEETGQLPSLMELDDFDSILDTEIVSIEGHGYLRESEGSFFPTQTFSSEVENAWSPTPSVRSELSTNQASSLLTLPHQNMEIENQVSLPHLLEAHGEALEQGQKSLAEVILRCMSQKASPLGESLERLVFYLSQSMTNHGDYLKGEAFKNFEAALRALYQGLPIGRVAHFAAVSAILEAMPQDCNSVHIVDSCVGHGFQWVPLIEAIAHMNKTVKLTSIKWGGGDECFSSPSNFEETRKLLCEHAKSCGLKLKVEEKGVEELVAEIKKMNKRGGKGAFLAFNSMIGLPHMGRESSRRQASEFLRVAEDLINTSGNRGIITFGDGSAYQKVKNNFNFRSFFKVHLEHYQALLEAIESHFPTRFSEARITMEQLFLQPCISSLDWLQIWEEMQSDEISFKGCQLSKNILMETREVLRGNEGSYQARIEGQNDNELVLEYKGTKLLRFSTWKN
ncbi:scarecrow-like protein 18 [Vigna unguiculata]|uniref:DELLA protein n=1 Tax=Vigna unguiculata TaxID=3917 RepID=A0A4D6MJC4_VIGUN|nr:scarecrow-like protein 18 [Vigna unguiculata]QCD99814.1 DELLA protein [Vigna unguiculata]